MFSYYYKTTALAAVCLRRAQVVWYHNNQPVQEAQDFQIVVEGEHFSLIIRETYVEDSGEYKITITNEFGSVESVCTLTISRK